MHRRRESGLANKFAEALEEAISIKISQNAVLKKTDQRGILYQMHQLENPDSPLRAKQPDLSGGQNLPQKSSMVPLKSIPYSD